MPNLEFLKTAAATAEQLAKLDKEDAIVRSIVKANCAVLANSAPAYKEFRERITQVIANRAQLVDELDAFQSMLASFVKQYPSREAELISMQANVYIGFFERALKEGLGFTVDVRFSGVKPNEATLTVAEDVVCQPLTYQNIPLETNFVVPDGYKAVCSSLFRGLYIHSYADGAIEGFCFGDPVHVKKGVGICTVDFVQVAIGDFVEVVKSDNTVS